MWGPQFQLLKEVLCHSVIVCSLVELPSLATLQMDMTKVREIYNFVIKNEKKIVFSITRNSDTNTKYL